MTEDEIAASIRQAATGMGIEASIPFARDGIDLELRMCVREVYRIAPELLNMSGAAVADRIIGDLDAFRRRACASIMATIERMQSPRRLNKAEKIAGQANTLLAALRAAPMLQLPGAALAPMARLESLLSEEAP